MAQGESFTITIVEKVNRLPEAQARSLLIEIFRTLCNEDFERSKPEVMDQLQSIYTKVIMGLDPYEG